MLSPKEIRSILVSAHGMHHSQFETLHVQPSKNGHTASFHNAVPGVELFLLEQKLSANPQLSNHQIEAYRRGPNVIVRIQKPGKTMKLHELRGATPRAYIKKEIRELLNINKDHYFNLDAYASKKDWVVVYYACELDLQVFRDKLNASKYFGDYSIKTERDNVYIRLIEPVVPEQFLQPRVKHTRTARKSIPAQVLSAPSDEIVNNDISVEFAKSVLSNIAYYHLSGDELNKLLLLCSNAISSKAVDIDSLNAIAGYIGKKIKIELV